MLHCGMFLSIDSDLSSSTLFQVKGAPLSISSPQYCDCETLFAPIRILDLNNTVDCLEWEWLPSYENGTLISNTHLKNDSSAMNSTLKINSTTTQMNGNLTLNEDKLKETVSNRLNGAIGNTDNKLGGGAIAGIVIGSIVGLILLVLITLAIIGFAIFKSKYRNAKYFVHDVSGKKSVSQVYLFFRFEIRHFY